MIHQDHELVQEYLTFSDLAGLDSSPDAVRSSFTKFFGTKPDGIALNKETYYDAVKPPITEQYSHYCYKKLGRYQFVKESTGEPQTAVVGSNTARNLGEQEAEISLSVQGAWTDTTGWSASVTEGLTFSEEFTIEGVFKMGMGFSISVTAGRSGSSSVSKSSSSTVTVKVPPKSQVKVQMVATMRKGKIDFKAPINVSGSFGANFPDLVNGHYFWFLGVSDVLPKNSGEISGTIQGAAGFDVHTEIGPAEPISA